MSRTTRTKAPMSESQIASHAAARLARAGYSTLRRVTCEFSEGVLTLSGRVEGYYHKQLAQTVVFGIPGVARIVNRIDVRSTPQRREKEFAS